MNFWCPVPVQVRTSTGTRNCQLAVCAVQSFVFCVVSSPCTPSQVLSETLSVVMPHRDGADLVSCLDTLDTLAFNETPH